MEASCNGTECIGNDFETEHCSREQEVLLIHAELLELHESVMLERDELTDDVEELNNDVEELNNDVEELNIEIQECENELAIHAPAGTVGWGYYLKLSYGYYGTIMVKVTGQGSSTWQGVCDDSFGQEEGDVICRMLGYRRASSVNGESYYSNSMVSGFAFDNVNCNGNEDSLYSCNYALTHNCGRSEYQGVACTY